MGKAGTFPKLFAALVFDYSFALDSALFYLPVGLFLGTFCCPVAFVDICVAFADICCFSILTRQLNSTSGSSWSF